MEKSRLIRERLEINPDISPMTTTVIRLSLLSESRTNNAADHGHSHNRSQRKRQYSALHRFAPPLSCVYVVGILHGAVIRTSS